MAIEIEWINIKTGVRTAGSLMVGNAFVANLVTGNKEWISLAVLLFFGVSAIIITSVKSKE